MALLDRQRRGRQIGEIRLGITVETGDGKRHPEKLDVFRFTTKSPSVAASVARLLGGESHTTTLLNGVKTYEVVTSVTEVPVMVPPGDAVINQWYEMWSAAGCARRCDGFTEHISGESCKCPSDLTARKELAGKGSACRPITRLNVMLPDIPDLGVWLVQSTGDNAADELGVAAEVLAAARNSGVIIPATLRMEQRESRRVGQPLRKFAVPVLEIRSTVREMTQLAEQSDIVSALPPPPSQMKALEPAKSVPQSKETVNLAAWIYESVPLSAQDDLKQEWRKRGYEFPASGIPLELQTEIRALVQSYCADDGIDGVTDAEVIYDGELMS